ncbi:MAG TPA: OmpA family protein [Chitinophagales bacterium]|nr:OmpA family protein [Chitinophagales bacterium]
MKKLIFFFTYYLLLTTYYSFAQVQWASKLIDFSSQYKDDLIRENSTRWSATQVLGFPNTPRYGSSQLAWTPQHQDGTKEFVTVGFTAPQTVQQVIVGENANAGAIAEIILYDNTGKKFTVYENDHPTPTQKMYDVLTYFKIKPTYNVVKLKLVINTNAVYGREEIDCIGISSTTTPYQHNINVIKYSEAVGQPENLGANVNSSYYDHLPLISPDGSMLYFTRKLSDENNAREFNDDIYYSYILPTGKFSKAENIGPPLNTSDHNFVCYVSSDNNRLYVANKYIKNTYNFAGLSVSAKQKDGSWSKPKPLNIPDLYNKNEFAHYYMNISENVALMSIQRDDSYGDLDLYVSKKSYDGAWSKPQNLGLTINTVGAEGSIFLAADGKTLYFSSTGHPGFGSYDMFMSKRLDDTWTNWSKPLNLGAQINSDEMDIYYTIPASGDYAYFSSGKTMYGLNDLYRIHLPKEIRPDFVDAKKLLTTQTPVNTISSPVTVNAQLNPKKTSIATSPPQTVNTAPKITTNTQPDDLQKKIDALKQQQTQATQPTSAVTPTVTKPVVQTPSVASVSVPSTTTTKKEVLNSIQPYQTPQEQRPKPETTNTIRPVETPKPAPKVLTPEEIAAREQQKNNPSVNPNSDGLATLTRTTMPQTPKQPAVQDRVAVTVPAPNYTINEVEPTVVSTPTTYNQPLKTNTPQTDELQQKLDALKKQQNQPTLNSPATSTFIKPSETKTIAEQYPNPQPVLPQTNAKTDDLQQKLDALKQQQREVGQSNKIYANPYEQKPYAPQPVKEKQEDKASQDYDDYQKKLDALKQQQKKATITANNKPVSIQQPTVNSSQPAVASSQPVVTPKTNIYSQPSSIVTQTPNPIISKYEEKLRKLKEEMNVLNAPTNTVDSKLPAVSSSPSPASTVSSTPITTEIPVKEEPKVETILAVEKPTVVIHTPATENLSIEPDDTTSVDLEREKAKLDSIQSAQKAAEQKMLETLDKMGTSKQSLEKDIVDLQEQRTKFNDEKDKLTAQNSLLIGEKEKLELEKKKMDDLLSQMQAERDKLAAEKLKIEQDKAKLELLKKQQERDVLALKRSIDSLGKIQQQTASNAQLQQKYDLFNVPLKVGAVAQVNNIYFVADASFLQIPSYPELDKVVLFLARNNTLKVEIGGHTNGLCDDAYCQKLSTSRAKTCVDYLISKGIASDRLSYKGYGKTQLLKPEAPGNPLNQRVEIKILSVD